ncbi:MAG TPA: SRPBCC family protein, partial [Verrucomicrobiae bacterium]
AGAGASMRWEGNNKVGVGTMTITDSQRANCIRLRLDFEKPMAGTSQAEFKFQAEGNRTVVTWSMSGPTKFSGKIFGLFMNCETMIGCQYEKGLANLAQVTE